MPRLWSVLVFLAAAACGGDDAHKHPATARGAVAPPATTPAPPPDAGPTPPATPAPLSEEMARPYFTTGDAGDGARAFALEQWSAARAAFTRARATATGDDVARLELLLGLTAARLADWPASATHLAAATRSLPLLGDYLRYHTARAQYFAKQLDPALELARQVAPESIVGADAELLVGDLLRAKADPAAVAAHYRAYLARRPEGMRRSEVRFRLAEALEQTAGDPAEIVALYRRIGIDDPLSSWTTKAQERLAALRPRLAKPLQAYDVLTSAERLVQANKLFDSMRNPESEAAFAAALADPAIQPGEKCIAAYHRAQSRFKARDRRGAAPLFEEAATACQAARNTDLHIKSLYQAGRSYAFTGQHDTATLLYQRAQQVDPAHSYSDDAMLREAEEWLDRGDQKQVEATLTALPTKFPQGDNVAEAMWRLGWYAWRAKNYDAAIGWWQKQIALVPHDDNYFGEGQAPYWLGRAYAAQGKRALAIASYERTIRQYPAAYYAMLALNRLRELDAKRYQLVVKELASDPTGFDAKAPAFAFKPRPEYATAGFQRALELLRLGLGGPAEAELRKLGLAAPGDKKRVDDADRIDKLWAMAFLFDRAGRFQSSHWPTRWHILDYRKSWPNGANRARWRIAYPRAYEELLARHAATNQLPFAMQIAIVREESAFDPLLESYANAVGLTQMIESTATRFAKGTGIPPTRESLRDPEKNVTIGSRFLGFLFAHWSNFVAFVPPSYNGGEGYVRRNLKTRGTWDTDEFIEGIVDDQIRNYSKRVLGTFFTYSWLYEQKVPEIPNAIPAALLPKP